MFDVMPSVSLFALVALGLFVSLTFAYLAGVGAQLQGRNRMVWQWGGFCFWLVPLMVLPLLADRSEQKRPRGP